MTGDISSQRLKLHLLQLILPHRILLICKSQRLNIQENSAENILFINSSTDCNSRADVRWLKESTRHTFLSCKMCIVANFHETIYFVNSFWFDLMLFSNSSIKFLIMFRDSYAGWV